MYLKVVTTVRLGVGGVTPERRLGSLGSPWERISQDTMQVCSWVPHTRLAAGSGVEVERRLGHERVSEQGTSLWELSSLSSGLLGVPKHVCGGPVTSRVLQCQALPFICVIRCTQRCTAFPAACGGAMDT